MKRFLLVSVLAVLALAIAACQQSTVTPGAPATPGKPNVVINSPPSNQTVQVGDTVQIQSTSTDSEGVVLVELIVDGATIQNSPTPNGQPQGQFSVIQTWTPNTPGQFTIAVKATNARLGAGQASITLDVIQRVAQATATFVVNPTAPIPTATPLLPTVIPTSGPPQPSPPPATCTLASTFIGDVTIPDGTVIAPGGSFVKTWAIQNSGTCTWGGGYAALLVAGESFGAPSPQAIPSAKPGDIINLSINMIAPIAPGNHSSVWQIQAPNGVAFGTKFDAVISIPGAPTPRPPTLVPPTNAPPPPTCNGFPFFSSFFANPSTITPGQVATLSWGPVQNASAVYLTTPSGTGGVGTPGALQVQPSQTTTYTLTAYCGNNPVQVQTTVTVQGNGPNCNGKPVFNGFYATPQTVVPGQQSTLNWGLVQNATAVYLQLPDKTEGVASPGSRNVKPSATTTYTLVAYCGSNQASIKTTVNVNTGCQGKPNFNGFSANPPVIQKGQSSNLSWGIVTNATAVVLQTPNGNSGVATPGNIVVTPKQTTTYTLIAYCNNTSASLSVTVTVNNPAPPTPTPPPVSPNRIQNVQVQRNGKGKWKLTVQYYWNGESPPAKMEAVGVGQAGPPATNVGSVSIIAGFVKFVIIDLTNNGSGPPVKFAVCMEGKGNTELACRTVSAP